MNFKETVNEQSSISCPIYVLNIIDYCSRLTRDEIKAILRNNPNSTLGNLEISDWKADTCVRTLINRKLKKPYGKPPIPRNTISSTTSVKKVIEIGCM